MQAGEALFQEGDQGDRAYVVQEGNVDIVKNGVDGEVILGTVEKGGIFGEMALIDDQPRMATAIAADKSTLSSTAAMYFNANFKSVILLCVVCSEYS